MHVPGLPELTHPRVDERNSRRSLLPSGEPTVVGVAPLKVIKATIEIVRCEIGPVEEQVVAELPPAHLCLESADALEQVIASARSWHATNAFKDLKR